MNRHVNDTCWNMTAELPLAQIEVAIALSSEGKKRIQKGYILLMAKLKKTSSSTWQLFESKPTETYTMNFNAVLDRLISIVKAIKKNGNRDQKRWRDAGSFKEKMGDVNLPPI